MYALKLGALWRALKNEHISFWMLCIYFFFEYVRPQSLYPVIDVLPWAQIFLLASLITAFTDKSVQWTKNALNRWLLLFTFVIILSGVFAFRPAVSIDYWTVFGGWLVV